MSIIEVNTCTHPTICATNMLNTSEIFLYLLFFIIIILTQKYSIYLPIQQCFVYKMLLIAVNILNSRTQKFSHLIQVKLCSLLLIPTFSPFLSTSENFSHSLCSLILTILNPLCQKHFGVLFFCFQLVSLSILSSKFTCSLKNENIFNSKGLSCIINMHNYYFSHSSLNRHPGCSVTGNSKSDKLGDINIFKLERAMKSLYYHII